MNVEARMSNDEKMTKPEDVIDHETRFGHDGEVLVVREEPPDKRVYDLEERTSSVGANHVEADDAVSKKEFLKNIGTCRKDARETKHFLRMAVRAAPELKPQARRLWMEAKELHLIFSKIWRSGK